MNEYVCGDIVFYLAPNQEVLKRQLFFIDDRLNHGHKIKDSRSTTAAVLELPGMNAVFAKRENNKGVRFTLRYLFRNSRVFRAAAAAARLAELGIATPRVLAVGSRRYGGVLRSGYLITESLNKVLKTEAVCKRLNTDPKFYAQFMSDVSRMVAVMHNHGILHGDLKMSNIYCQDQPDGYQFGLWDLDGVEIRSRAIGMRLRARELGRIVSSYARVSHEQCGCSVDVATVIDALSDQYRRYAPLTPPREVVAHACREFLRRYGLNI
ncbi:MAG: lipopolysaccharide kinase InaA family protein [Victivallales bacterium]|nr:lipopolysaccharide kinase InaA family protein [Victivallales bacterium]